jgi:hypothetical protein
MLNAYQPPPQNLADRFHKSSMVAQASSSQRQGAGPKQQPLCTGTASRPLVTGASSINEHAPPLNVFGKQLYQPVTPRRDYHTHMSVWRWDSHGNDTADRQELDWWFAINRYDRVDFVV